MLSSRSNNTPSVSGSALLVTLGIIFGDIGTSPLYVLKAVIGESEINPELVLGGVSCIFWTLTLQATIKYVILVLRADNRGEGGIFALYALVRKTKIYWLIIPAMIGGSALIADGILTPAISVSSAIEGLRALNPGIGTEQTRLIVIVILSALFAIQQFGTGFVGKFFGPIMLVWFLMLGILGIFSIAQSPHIIQAVNPYYAYHLLAEYPDGFWVLGAVFLCTTGAEGMYSDMGHCGKTNIRITWSFVKTMLVLNYFGQGAWLLQRSGIFLQEANPFYSIMPSWFLVPGIVIATCATIVASQALITASYTIINEAIRLNFWPKIKIIHPTNYQGQMYIPSVNWLLFAGCIGVVLYFGESKNMEAAYGLTINIDMLMTSALLVFFMLAKRYTWLTIVFFALIYSVVEYSFLAANLSKFVHGGWVSFLIGAVLVSVMWIWFQARKIRNRYVEFVKLDDYLPAICELSRDSSVPKYATHLVYLTSANDLREIESAVVQSVLENHPKRADIYWFVHVDVGNEPYRMEYKVTTLSPGEIMRIDFFLGFRNTPRVNLLFEKVVQDLMASGEVDFISRYESQQQQNKIGDFRFVVLEKFLSYENELPFYEKWIMDGYFLLRHISQPDVKAFGLDMDNVTVEKVPLVINPVKNIPLKRIY